MGVLESMSVLPARSIMTSLFQRPLDLGADICMTSLTKFIGGHSDLTGGTLSVKGTELCNRVYFTQVLCLQAAASCHTEVVTTCMSKVHELPMLRARSPACRTDC
jgi:cystathionine beta-lyase/cystathionine gamma-synthase